MSGILAIDFGGTRTRAGWYDATMTLQKRAEIATQVERGQAAVLKRIIAVGREVVPTGENPHAIGVAAPGPLDAATGTILHAETLPGWQHVRIGQIISAAFDHAPTFVENDANLGVIAEVNAGAAVGADPAIYLTLSTGIGGGAWIGGELFTGYSGLASEPGHQLMTLPDGSVRKMEELASGTALGKNTAAKVEKYRDDTILRGHKHITGKLVGEAALAGDDLALRCVHEAGRWLGLGIVNLLHLFNPQVVVLGGSMTNLGDLLLDPLRETLEAYVLSPGFLHPNLIQLAALGDDVCLVGAAFYAQSAIETRKENLLCL